MNMKIRLRPDLLEKAKIDITRYRVAEVADVAPGTSYTILGDSAQNMKRIDLDALSRIFTAIGLSAEDVAAMRISDIFTIQVE